MSERTRVIVPHRGLHASKTRLAPMLDPDEREELAERLLTRVLGVAGQAVDDVVVISPEVELGAIVERAGARLAVQRGLGLNQGLHQAREEAMGDGIDVLVVLHGDLPNLHPDEIRRLVADCPAPVGVTVAPDRAGTGTNGLCLRPPDALGFGFGKGSFERHCGWANGAGIPLAVLRSPGLAFDLDTPADLARWLELGDAA